MTTILSTGPQSRRVEREDWDKLTVLFAICIDDAVMDALQPWAADIRRSRRHIGDSMHCRLRRGLPLFVRLLHR